MLTNFEIMPKPAESRTEDHPWPYWPFVLKTSSSHEEGIHREWSILTKEFVGDKNGKLKGLKTVEVSWKKNSRRKDQNLLKRKGVKKNGPATLLC